MRDLSAPSKSASFLAKLEPVGKWNVTARLRKLPYYVASYVALRGLIAKGRILPRPSRRVELRDGLSFSVSGLLDLLILKETFVDDVYGLRELDGTAPGCIVDVGAGFGDFSVLAATRFPSADVLAFEPLPAAFQLLGHNLIENGIKNVTARQLAVGTRGSETLVSGRAQARASASSSRGRAVVVPARRLEDLLERRSPDLLKIDCEGAELDVLESAGDALSRARRIVVEYHRRLLPDADRLVAELLTKRGFDVRIRPDPYDRGLGYVVGTTKSLR